jgi:predicted anti-sigma-YlaC factor YlaD
MGCNEFRMMISKGFDGEIEDSERQALERHLYACEDCRLFKESLIQILLIHRELVEVQPPHSLLSAVIAAVEKPRSKVQGWINIAVPVAAALIMLLGYLAGDFLAESFVPAGVEDQAELLELDYLEEYPPGSMGDVLMAAMEEGRDE